MGRKGKATQPSCDERNPRGRAGAELTIEVELTPSKPRRSRLFK